MAKISKSKLNKIKKSELIEMLADLLNDEEDVEDDKVVNEPEQESNIQTLRRENEEFLNSKGIGNGTPSRIESVTAGPRENKFFEMEKSVSLDKEVKRAAELDKILKPGDPVPRQRPNEYVTLVCKICRKSFRAHTSEAKSSRCNECSAGR